MVLSRKNYLQKEATPVRLSSQTHPASQRWTQWLKTPLKFWKASCLHLYNRGKFANTLWENKKTRKELVPCVRRLGENARKAKAAPSKHCTHVNSVAFLCVAKCVVKGLAFMNGTAKLCRNTKPQLFLYCMYPCYFYYNAVLLAA